MIRQRVIPALLLEKNALVKTINFTKPFYIGDPINTVRIFNELFVDELMILNINLDYQRNSVNLDLLKNIASECFIPLSYGGGIKSVKEAEKIFRLGFEKIVVNSFAFLNKGFLEELIKNFGSQSIIHSIDIKRNLLNPYSVYIESGTKKIKVKLFEWLNYIEEIGVGELLVTNIDKEGTWDGFDFELIKKISNLMSIPVIAHGGCKNIEDIRKIFRYSNANAAAIGNMFVFQKKGMGVLVNYLTENELEKIF